MKYKENTIRNKILFVIAILCAACILLYWPGKDVSIAEKEDIKKAEEARLSETEMLAPDFVLTAADGHTVNMRKLYNEQPVYLLFWMSGSEACKEQLAAVQRIWNTYGKNIYFVVVSLDGNKQDAAAFMQDVLPDRPFYMASVSVADDYGVTAVPSSVLIAKGGQIARQHTGVMSGRELAYFIEKRMHDAAP